MTGLERRHGKPAVPPDLKDILSQEQMRTYHTMQGCGWRMYFVRRPLFQEPTVALINNEGTRVGVLEQEGHFDMEPLLELRN